jgi:hypothetical protein
MRLLEFCLNFEKQNKIIHHSTAVAAKALQNSSEFYNYHTKKKKICAEKIYGNLKSIDKF